LEKSQDSLRAAINGLAADGTSAHVILSEGDHPEASQPSPYLLRGGERLFPIRSTTITGLLEQLTELESLLSTQIVYSDFRSVLYDLPDRIRIIGPDTGACCIVK
jgi:acyl transferase domain-containing protein